jgi:GT2 family glycosyltransferase
MPRPIASIILLTRDDGDYLRECLAAVKKHTDVPHEVIVVDNASRGGPPKNLGSARLIRNEANRFFAAGNNQGILAARGEHVVLLNADAVPGPGWLSLLLRRSRDPGAGLVGPCTNFASGVQHVVSPGYASMREFPSFARRWAREHAGKSREAHRLIAFCLLIRREALDRVGLLDERFGPGGYEDYDYCLRVRQAGLRILLAEDAFVHHYGAKGYGGLDYARMRLVNRELLAMKWSRAALHALDEMDSLVKSAGGLVK